MGKIDMKCRWGWNNNDTGGRRSNKTIYQPLDSRWETSRLRTETGWQAEQIKIHWKWRCQYPSCRVTGTTAKPGPSALSVHYRGCHVKLDTLADVWAGPRGQDRWTRVEWVSEKKKKQDNQTTNYSTFWFKHFVALFLEQTTQVQESLRRTAVIGCHCV